MENVEQNQPDRIYETFFNKTIFLTGGTGYLGKVYIERLLRMFDVKKIYILIRTKKDQTPASRFEKLFTSPLYDKVRQEKGDEILSKCHIIPGDISLDNLGISESDRLILQREVEFVFHSAATVRFDEALKTAVPKNVKAVQQAIKVAKGMERLQMFVHVSTAFCHPEQALLNEKFYKTSMKPDQVIQMIDWLSDKQVNNVTAGLLDGIPNNYTFTKSLGEEIVSSEIDNLPIIVVRPSIIIPIWKEPIRGWTDNLNGPLGLFIAGGKGVVKSMYGNRHARADFISVDAAADLTFCAIVYSVQNRNTSKIFNLCTSSEIDVAWGEIMRISANVATTRIPFDTILWRPGGRMRNSRILHLLALLVYQLIPALIVDALASCFGYKPFLWKIQKRILNGMQMLEYYTKNEWIFSNDNILEIRKWMTLKEKSRYIVSNANVDLIRYVENCIYAARKYILKEPDENLPRAKRMMNIMVWIDRIVSVLIKFLLAYLFYKYIFCIFIVNSENLS